jgi:hypothetical protein
LLSLFLNPEDGGNTFLHLLPAWLKKRLIGIMGGGVQLGPLGTAATNRPTVPAQGDYDDGEFDGMMIGRGNQSTRRKPAPVPLCPSQIPHACPDDLLGLLINPEDRCSMFLRNIGKHYSAHCLRGLLFDLEDRGSTFLRNNSELQTEYMASHYRRQYSSQPIKIT